MLKVKTTKKKLLPALLKAQSIIEKKNIMQMINNVFIYTKEDHLIIEATDLEIFFRVKVPVEVIKEGELVIAPRKLSEIIKEIPKDIIILEELDNYWLKIPVGNLAEYTLAGLEPIEFPKFKELPKEKENNMMYISSEIMKDLIERTISAVAVEERTYSLSGVLLEVEREDSGEKKIKMVGSDGHRLNYMEYELDNDFPIEDKFSVILLKKGANEIKKLAEDYEKLSFTTDDEKFFHITTKNEELAIRIIEEEYPDYAAIIPDKVIRFFDFSRKAMISALKRIFILIEDPLFKGIKLKLSPGKVEIESMDKKIGDAIEFLNISYSDEPFDLALNGRFLLEVLQVMKSDIIEFSYNNEDSPCILKGDEDKGFIGLIMPMSLEKDEY